MKSAKLKFKLIYLFFKHDVRKLINAFLGICPRWVNETIEKIKHRLLDYFRLRLLPCFHPNRKTITSLFPSQSENCFQLKGDSGLEFKTRVYLLAQYCYCRQDFFPENY